MRTRNEPHWRTMVWLGSCDGEKNKPVVYEPSSAVRRRLVTWDGALRPGGLNGLAVAQRCGPSPGKVR